ncbi:MAG: hypothetical protein HOP19_21440 [Acidobacteria bacterium]|nr:hypothetical protein [Acidobacteriota bacterium]
MRVLLSSFCLLCLLTVLALPLALIVSEFFAEAARKRRHQTLLTNDAPRESHSIY